jgi:hypothetical protein
VPDGANRPPARARNPPVAARRRAAVGAKR